MKSPARKDSDGLEWLRNIRRSIQSDIGQTPQERAAYYEAKEKELAGRMRAFSRRRKPSA